jgi:polynucleotide 5'-kinase involved in rRNA processing
MSTSYTLKHFVNMRGYKELTQGEAHVERMLIDKAKELKSKVLGFKATRKYVLNYEFKRDSVLATIELGQSIHDGLVDGSSEIIQLTMKSLLEQTIRYHVPLDIAHLITLSFYVISKKKEDVEQAIDVIHEFLRKAPNIVELIDFAEKITKEHYEFSYEEFEFIG